MICETVDVEGKIISLKNHVKIIDLFVVLIIFIKWFCIFTTDLMTIYFQ
jgi:hypothetical protein